MKAGILILLGVAAGALLLLKGGGSSSSSAPRAVVLERGKRYRFSGYVKPPLPDDQVEVFSSALDVEGGFENATLTQKSDRTLVRYEQTAQGTETVTIGQPMGLGFLPGEFVLTEARAL